MHDQHKKHHIFLVCEYNYIMVVMKLNRNTLSSHYSTASNTASIVGRIFWSGLL